MGSKLKITTLFLLFVLLPVSVFCKSQERERYYIENISDTDIIFVGVYRGSGGFSIQVARNTARSFMYIINATRKDGHLEEFYRFETVSLYDKSAALFMTLEDIREDSFFTEVQQFGREFHFLPISQQDIEEGRRRYSNQPKLTVWPEFNDRHESIIYAEDLLLDTDRETEWIIEKGTLIRYRGVRHHVVIPDSVIAIGDGAFKGNPVVSVVIPDTVLSIGDSAFETCRRLESVVIPESVREIGSRAFLGCPSLRSANLPQNLREISSETFKFCRNLELRLPENIVSIGASAFAYCAAITELSLPSGLVSIGDEAFLNCTGIKRLAIPGSLREAGSMIFLRLTSLEELTLGSGLLRIEPFMFSYNESLRSLVLPVSVEVIGEGAFRDCKNLVSVSMPGVRIIENYAFSRCESLKDLVFPESLEAIGREAFDRCASLTAIRLQKNLSRLGSAVFANSGVKSFTVDRDNPYFTSVDGVVFDKTLQTLVMYPASGSAEYQIPHSVSVIGLWAFSGSLNLSRVHFHPGITEIQSGAFFSCRKLQAAYLPEGLRSIAPHTFMHCVSLTIVTLPQSLEEIGARAFNNCGLTSLTLPSSLKFIAQEAFYNGGVFTSVVIPPSVESVGREAFSFCSNLKEIIISRTTEADLGNFSTRGNARDMAVVYRD